MRWMSFTWTSGSFGIQKFVLMKNPAQVPCKNYCIRCSFITLCFHVLWTACYIYLYKSCKDQCILRFLWAICPVVSHVFWGWYILVWTRSNQYDLTPRTRLYVLAVRVMNPHHLSRFNQLCTEALSCCRLIVWKHWHRKSSFLYYCYFWCFQYFVLNRVLTFLPYELKNIHEERNSALSLSFSSCPRKSCKAYTEAWANQLCKQNILCISTLRKEARLIRDLTGT